MSGWHRRRLSQLAPADAVSNVNYHADQEPDDQPQPGRQGQRGHQENGGNRAGGGDEPNGRRGEVAGQVGLAHAQHQDTDGHDHKGEQGADRAEAASLAHAEHRREERHSNAGHDGGNPRGAKARMHPADYRRQQPVAGHAVEDPGLKELEAVRRVCIVAL